MVAIDVNVQRVITSVEFKADPAFAFLGAGEPKEVHATFTDGATVMLFAFYSDELTFTEADLVGLTEPQARKLHFDRDMEYLRT